MSHTTYGRAGGPSIQQLRENWGQSVTSILVASGDATTAKPMLPVTTGEDYYLIWGWSAGTNLPTGEAAYGYIQTTDESKIAAFAITAQGPMMMTFDLPVKLAPGQGVNCKLLATLSGPTPSTVTNPRVLPVVYYSKVIV